MIAFRRQAAMLALVVPFLLPAALHADNWRFDRFSWRNSYQYRTDDHRDGYGGRAGYRWSGRYRDGSRAYGRGYNSATRLGYDQGYRDGLDKGLQDYRKGRRPDLRRHGRYKDADHGYKRQYGPKAEYRHAYREGFVSGYREGYRGRWNQ